MIQESLFDYAAGKEAKEAGQASVELHNIDFVTNMRDVARAIARENGTVSADDLRRYAAANDIKPAHPNAWGSIFRGKGWRVVGRKKSALRTNNSREIKIWELVA